MFKKITLLIIFVAAIGAVMLGYLAIYKDPAASAQDTTAVPRTASILPYGTDLNFDEIKKFNKNGQLFPYPTVTPADIGPALGEIIKQ